MSSPVSSDPLLISLQAGLVGAVLDAVVGEAGLPAVPDDVEPGSREDANGVRMVVATGGGWVVEVFGPWIGVAGVTGEVAHGVAQLLVAGPAEADRPGLARLACGWGDTGQAGQRRGGWEAGAAVADLAEQAGGPDLAASSIHDRDRVIVARPVAAAGQSARRFLRQGGWGRLHDSLLAAEPNGRHPSFGARALLPHRSLIGANGTPPCRRSARPGNRQASQNSSWTSNTSTSRAMTRRHLGCTSDPPKITDLRMVYQ